MFKNPDSKISWENTIKHIFVEKSGKKELTVHFINGKITSDYIVFLGERINSPFKPWFLAAKCNLKEFSDSEICEDIERKFLNWIS